MTLPDYMMFGPERYWAKLRDVVSDWNFVWSGRKTPPDPLLLRIAEALREIPDAPRGSSSCYIEFKYAELPKLRALLGELLSRAEQESTENDTVMDTYLEDWIYKCDREAKKIVDTSVVDHLGRLA